MSAPSLCRRLSLAPLLLICARALAADDEPTLGSELSIDLESLEGLSLESLFDVDVVTATKTARSIDEVPAMIDVITAEQIRQRGYRHLADLLNDLPDNHEDRTNWGIGEPLNQNVGFGFRFDTGQNILLLFNGQRLNALLPGNRFGMEEYLLDNVDRVEIIRGPGSALYGANAFTAVVNVISKSEMQPGERSYVRASAGGVPTAGGGSGELSWKADLGGSLLSGALRVGAERGQELLIENALFGDATVRDGVLHAIDGEIFFQRDTLRLYGRLDHQLRNTVTGFNGVQPSDNRALTLLGYAASLGFDYTHALSQRVQLKYSGGTHLDNWTEVGLIPIFQLNEAGDGLLRDEQGAPLLDTVSVTRDGQALETSFLIDGQGGDTLTSDAEVQLTFNYFDESNLIFGLSGSYDKIVNPYRDTEIQLDPPSFIPLQRLDDDTNNWLFDTTASRFTAGSYAQIDHALADQLFSYAGARFDVYTGTGLLNQTYTAFNPRAGLVWKNPAVGTFKALFGQATRIPNGFEALSSVTILGSPDNRPEQIYTLQGGWGRTFAEVLEIQGGYFYSIIANHLVTDANITELQQAQGYVGRFINVEGESLYSHGVDGKITLRLSPLAIYANATRHLGTDDGSGNPIAYIPLTMANLNAGSDLWWFFLNIGLNYRGDFTRAVGDPRPEIGDYVLLTPTLSFNPPDWPLAARVGARNLLDLDVRYPSSSLDFTDHFPSRGRELWADLTYTQRF